MWSKETHFLFLLHPGFPQCCWENPWSKYDLNVASRSWSRQVFGFFLAFCLFFSALIWTWRGTSLTNQKLPLTCLVTQEANQPYLQLSFSPAALSRSPNSFDFLLDFWLECVPFFSAAMLPAPLWFSPARRPSFSGYCLFPHFQAFNIKYLISHIYHLEVGCETYSIGRCDSVRHWVRPSSLTPRHIFSLHASFLPWTWSLNTAFPRTSTKPSLWSPSFLLYWLKHKFIETALYATMQGALDQVGQKCKSRSSTSGSQLYSWPGLKHQLQNQTASSWNCGGNFHCLNEGCGFRGNVPFFLFLLSPKSKCKFEQMNLIKALRLWHGNWSRPWRPMKTNARDWRPMLYVLCDWRGVILFFRRHLIYIINPKLNKNWLINHMLKD